jgi:signal transduction histidine kinase
VTVSDSGRGASADAVQHARDGIGLSNTRSRLEHLYPGRHALTVTAPPAGGFAVTIAVPATAVAPDEELADVLDISA